MTSVAVFQKFGQTSHIALFLWRVSETYSRGSLSGFLLHGGSLKDNHCPTSALWIDRSIGHSQPIHFDITIWLVGLLDCSFLHCTLYCTLYNVNCSFTLCEQVSSLGSECPPVCLKWALQISTVTSPKCNWNPAPGSMPEKSMKFNCFFF